MMPERDEPYPAPNPLNLPRVMIVDDDPAVLTYLAMLMKLLKFIPIQAMNAAEAMARFKAGEDVDILISDVRMPGSMDGFALARTVREARPHLPILLISGYTDITEEESLGLFAEPKVEFIPKPFSKHQLESKLHMLLVPAKA